VQNWGQKFGLLNKPHVQPQNASHGHFTQIPQRELFGLLMAELERVKTGQLLVAGTPWLLHETSRFLLPHSIVDQRRKRSWEWDPFAVCSLFAVLGAFLLGSIEIGHCCSARACMGQKLKYLQVGDGMAKSTGTDLLPRVYIFGPGIPVPSFA
jgi:hypothetical protein